MGNPEFITPPESPYEELARLVEVMPDQEVRRGFIDLIQAIDTQSDCICSRLDQVVEGDAVICGYHGSKMGYVLHLARGLDPRKP